MRAKTRRYRQIALVAVAAAVLLGVNVPPAFNYVQDWRHERLINSPAYKAQYGHWDTIEVPPDNRVNAIHAVLMNDGKVLLIAGSGNKEDMFATKALKSMVYDPATGQSKMIPVPDDMFCGGQTVLPDGRVLFAGGTQRYEKLDGAVTNAAGAMRIKNENPTAPRFLPAGTEFTSPSGQKYRSDFDASVPPAVKTGTGLRTKVTASEEKVFVEADQAGPAAVNGNRDKYSIAGLNPADAKNLYGLGEPMTLDKQDYQGTDKAYTFDPKTEQWSEIPNMNQPRWYPEPDADVGRQHPDGGRAGRGRAGAQRPDRDVQPADEHLDRPQGPHPVLPDVPGDLRDRDAAPDGLHRLDRRVRAGEPGPGAGVLEHRQQPVHPDPRPA